MWSEPEQRFFFIGRDVTDSRRAQQELKQEIEERRRAVDVLNNTITSMADAVLVVDADGETIISNPAASKIFGTTPAIGSTEYRRDFRRYYPDRTTPLPVEQAALYRSLRGELIDDLEFIVQPTGVDKYTHLVASSRPLRDAEGRLIGAVGVYRDITESKKAQEALRESEQMSRGIIDTALDGFIQLDESATVIDWNPTAEAMFGWSRQDAIGKKLSELIIPAEQRQQHAERHARLLLEAGTSTSGRRFEIEAVRRNGTRLLVEVAMNTLHRHTGYVFNGFFRDLTEKKAAEEQLRQALKMEAVGQLTGGIAHDFNNMLTVITGTIDMLAEAVADRPQLAAVARLISEAADRGAELTGYLLAFARKQPLQPRETDINGLIDDARRLLRPLVGESVEIASRLAEQAWPALVDPTQLTAALLNLASNARDAMPNGGKLMLETENVVLDEAYAQINGDVRPGQYVLIAVSDTGTGIPAEIREKIFEPFFSTKDTGKGTGLGLSMVYGFVKQSGGHLKVYSEQGHGTTFRIYLPRAETSAPAAEATSESNAESGTETVLLVEDDPLVRSTVIAQLQRLGYTTLPAASAAEALAIVDSGTSFDLLFTDVIVPGVMNGRQLAEEIAKRRPNLKVLYTSGYTENAIIHHGRLDPGVLLLAKPYRTSELARMLRRALGGDQSGAAQPSSAKAARAG